MRNFVKSLGIIAIAAAIGFGLVSCNIPEKELPVLTGTVSISGTAQVGQTLTANTSTLGGSGVISFEWKRGGNVSIGTNSSNYIVQAADVGFTITVTVSRSDRVGSVVSAPTVSISALPVLPVITINTQPAATTNVTVGDISGNLSVAASVTQGATLNYQWQQSSNIAFAGALIVGGNSPMLTIPTGLAAGTYYFRVLVSATGGASSVTSSTATVNVVALPVITIDTQPAATTNVTVGDISGNLSVVASVTQGATLNYQWQQSSNIAFTGAVAVGGNSPSLTIPTGLAAGTYYFRVIVSATGGASSVTSSTATVNVVISVFTVDFVMQGGIPQVPTQTVFHNDLATRPPANPTREGYTFLNWFTTATGTTVFDFNAPITSNRTAYARWTAIYHAVTFNTNGGTIITQNPMLVKHGQTISSMPITTRDGFTFVDWYTDSYFANAFIEDSAITTPITLFARWELITGNGTFTILFADFENDAPQIVGPTFSIFSEPAILEVFNPGYFRSIRWFMGTRQVGADTTLTLNNSVHGNTLGTHVVTLMVVLDTTGRTLTRTIVFITNDTFVE
jgi:uncharacterized repeat protein (TIGR02543 family)